VKNFFLEPIGEVICQNFIEEVSIRAHGELCTWQGTPSNRLDEQGAGRRTCTTALLASARTYDDLLYVNSYAKRTVVYR
jgi:hypothetical protein